MVVIFGITFGKRLNPSASANSALMKKHWPVRARDRNALSHLGGDPMLPSAGDWPRCVFQGEDQPMHFLAQIDCAALPDFEGRALLPKTGLLSFFLLMHIGLGAEAENICAVRYFPNLRGLQRQIPPADLMPNYDGRTYDQGFMDYLPPAMANLAVRRFAFVPVSLEPFVTHVHPEASPMAPWGAAPEPTKENLEAYYAERNAAMEAVLGKEPEDDNPAEFVLEPSWPETVYAARHALEIGATSLLNRYTETFSMTSNEDGSPSSPPELSATSLGWLEKLKLPQEMLENLKRRPILEDPGAKVREIVNDVVDQVGGLNFYQAMGAPIRLLRQFNVEDVPCSPKVLEKARALAQEVDWNSNQIMGFQQEVQGGSNETALKKAKRWGWAPKEAQPTDMQLLAQFDTCYGGWGAMFASSGKAFFYIQKSDLAEGRFDRVVSVVEGT